MALHPLTSLLLHALVPPPPPLLMSKRPLSPEQLPVISADSAVTEPEEKRQVVCAVCAHVCVYWLDE